MNRTPPMLTPVSNPKVLDAFGGHWYLDRDSARLTLALTNDGQGLKGELVPENSPENSFAVEVLQADLDRGHLELRALERGGWYSYIIDVADGVLTGRYAQTSAPASSVAATEYAGHLVGWRSETFDNELVPRVYDLDIAQEEHAKLRFDRSPNESSRFIGELKVYATASAGADGELPERNVLVSDWDGTHLSFAVTTNGGSRLFSGTVAGRAIGGTVVEPTGVVHSFVGHRADVLSYGLSGRSADARATWQDNVRQRLSRLMMAGNPAPAGMDVEIGPDRAPFSGAASGDLVDYRLNEIDFRYTLPNPYGSEPLVRNCHGYLATPADPPPPQGYGLVLALNGHMGSAAATFDPNSMYWYGDAFARRGYVVLSIDVSHRPPSQSAPIYGDMPDGDDPDQGNHAHPAIAAPGLDSDWTEMGERAWDAMRGIDYLLTIPNGNPATITVTGLSMGGELTDLVAALDPRVSVALPACGPTDLSLLYEHGGHPCWLWNHGDVREFVDISDFIAMMAPRSVLRQAGKLDPLYSSYNPSFVSEKEVVRRGRIAFTENPQALTHYLHDDGHAYHAGDGSTDRIEALGLLVPAVSAPADWFDESTAWSADNSMIPLNESLFDYVASLRGTSSGVTAKRDRGPLDPSPGGRPHGPR